MSTKKLPDPSTQWELRLARVRRSQARTDTTGMTRPPRNPDERAFLERTGQTGPFREVPKPTKRPGQN